MNNLQKFFDTASEWQKEYINWNKKLAKPLSFGLGISISGIVAGILGFNTNPPTPDTIYFWIIVFSSGGISVVILFLIMHAIGARLATKHTELSKNAQELEFFRRAGDKLGSFMFFVAESNFDKVLGWFHGTNSRPLNMVIAQLIKEQLDRAFESTIISIPIHSYADHSNVLAQLLPVAENVCLTCNKSPKNWFISLSDDGIEHKELPEELQPSPSIEQNKLDGYADNLTHKYPSHFVRFLQPASIITRRRRAFLLNEDEWASLIDPKNYEFFRKFIEPCTKRQEPIDTRFVHVKRLEYMADKRGPYDIDNTVTRATEANVSKMDYDIFENRAMLIYIDVENSREEPPEPKQRPEPKLEFHVGERVTIYADFLDLIFNPFTDEQGISTANDYGIYQSDEIERIIIDRTPPTPSRITGDSPKVDGGEPKKQLDQKQAKPKESTSEPAKKAVKKATKAEG